MIPFQIHSFQGKNPISHRSTFGGNFGDRQNFQPVFLFLGQQDLFQAGSRLFLLLFCLFLTVFRLFHIVLWMFQTVFRLFPPVFRMF